MKEVTITVTLLLEDDQPCCDWVYESIDQQLDKDKGEEILSYSDSELIQEFLGM
jgi:hypothetical protein